MPVQCIQQILNTLGDQAEASAPHKRSTSTFG